MRIVHLILTSHFAGSERHVIELANAQAQHHEVTLVLRKAAAKNRPGAYAHKVDPKVKLVLVGDWLARWHARKLLRQWQPDVVHAHLSLACKALHGLKGVGLRLATLHICYKPQQHAALDALVAIAPWQLAAIAPRLQSHAIQVDNWTLPSSPAPDARQRLRQAHGIAPDAWVFGAMGRVEPSKGFDLLIDAFKRAALPGAHLVIVGHGHQLAALRRQAVPGVHLIGFSEQPQDWLAAFDCFVSPARDEPFGLVMLEAMQAGLPMLASQTQGALHLNAVMASRLVPLQDVAALTSGLRELAHQRPARQSYAMERFKIGAKLAQLEAFYRAELAALSGATNRPAAGT